MYQSGLSSLHWHRQHSVPWKHWDQGWAEYQTTEQWPAQGFRRCTLLCWAHLKAVSCSSPWPHLWWWGCSEEGLLACPKDGRQARRMKDGSLALQANLKEFELWFKAKHYLKPWGMDMLQWIYSQWTPSNPATLGLIKVSWLEGWPTFQGWWIKPILGLFWIQGWPHFRGPD